jgi:Flp pilus assembly protein TadG
MVLLMVAMDITIMMLGYQLNDRACRAATRSAAQQSSSAKALAAVNAALLVHRGDGIVISSPKLSTQPGSLVYNDFNGNPYSGNPTVSVCTEVTVKVPAPVIFFNQQFGCDSAGVKTVWTFRKRYTYPILDVNLVLP